MLLLAAVSVPRASADITTTDFCDTGTLGAGSATTDLVLNRNCMVDGTKPKYIFRNVNVVSGGKLTFKDANINFYARSILVQNGGAIAAVVGAGATNNRTLTIHLYGSPGDPPITCKKLVVTTTKSVQDDLTCGIPPDIWTSNTFGAKNPATCTKVSALGKRLPGNIDDCFYQYGKLVDGDPDGAYFGHKVFAVSYGGSLNFYGAKGATLGGLADPSNSALSWGRLNATLLGNESSLTLDRGVDWQPNDYIVVTSTDYLPGHAEKLQISTIGGTTANSILNLVSPVAYPHNGTRYDYSSVPAGIGPDQDPKLPLGTRYIETRAAVGLLTRSIRIISDGATPDAPFTETDGSYYGGHTVFRQGFTEVKVTGVEFYQLGQGGAKGHYPVHFHMARQVPANTWVTDSTIHDSMTRWITVHATQGVVLARNVGYLSIGHGFYLEDGTETDNKFYSNLGVFARAAVINDQNKRHVPGILARPGDAGAEIPPFHSDYDHPTIFWIMNGWNDFEYNVASGAGTCGMCYWLLPGGISGGSQYEKWEGYAGQQAPGREGLSPLQKFVGNSCSTAMMSFLTVNGTSPCKGVQPNLDGQQLPPVPNPLAPALGDPKHDDYYPRITGKRNPTICLPGVDCSSGVTNPPCPASGPFQVNCAVTTLDHYTTSFNWAQKNFAAMWLRNWFTLVTDSAITDSQQGGLTFVTGGGYTRSDAAVGFWDLLRKSVLVGSTQPNVNGTQFSANPYASNAGPFNPSALSCDFNRADYCMSAAQGITFDFDAQGVNQRLFNIYDGPAYQEKNAYLDVHTTDMGTVAQCNPVTDPGVEQKCSPSFGWMYSRIIGVPKDNSVAGGLCYLPNAAIAWKQSNGFYYPPAFHSSQLYFDKVDIRHFVIVPDFLATSTRPGFAYQTNLATVQNKYCTWRKDMFDNYTDVDRQTELNDDDGSLTGLLGQLTPATTRETISVSLDPFFKAPKVALECSSDRHSVGTPATDPPGTVDTSPYEYVTTAMIPACGNGLTPNDPNPPILHECGGNWHHDCGGPQCYGVPLYRQLLTSDEVAASARPFIRMAGQGTGQRSTLSVNHSKYYIDTQVSSATQSANASKLNVFQANETYYVWFIYANDKTQQTYTFFVGAGLSPGDQSTLLSSIQPQRVDISSDTYGFSLATGTNFITKNYDVGTGIVTVDVNLSSYATEFSTEAQKFCQPTSYCQFSSGVCGCKAGTDCKDSNVCRWATKEIDCPTGGCFGFAWKMPGTFTTGQTPPPAGPPYFTPFTSQPDYATNWNIPFKNVDATVSGAQCHYAVAP